MTTFPSGQVVRITEDTVAIHSTLGLDWVRVCIPHRWASREQDSYEGLPMCPHCELASDHAGHARFADLQLRMMPVEAPR